MKTMLFTKRIESGNLKGLEVECSISYDPKAGEPFTVGQKVAASAYGPAYTVTATSAR